MFREIAHSTLLSSFELAGNDSDAEGDPGEAPQYPNPVPPPPPSTLVHPAPLLAPPPPLGCPVWERHALHHLDPSDFGPHGCHKEVIANAYEDWLNGIPMANLITADLKYATEFILDDAHLANPVISEDVDLPDAPTFHEAMAGPE